MGYFLFSLLCYTAGIGSMIWFFWFIQFVIDLAPAPFSTQAALWNTVLFLVFPLQHSLLARSAVKQQIATLLPPLLERPLYVGTSGIAMAAVLSLWKPIGPDLYRFQTSLPFDIVFYAALILILFTLRIMGHSTMFGLSHGYALWKHQSLPQESLKTSGLFRIIRHPLTSLFIVMLWSHESMTLGRLQFNLLFTVYSIAGIWFEERDLINKYGDEYKEYKRNVPAFIPWPK